MEPEKAFVVPVFIGAAVITPCDDEETLKTERMPHLVETFQKSEEITKILYEASISIGKVLMNERVSFIILPRDIFSVTDAGIADHIMEFTKQLTNPQEVMDV
jgi:hypothetical protein